MIFGKRKHGSETGLLQEEAHAWVRLLESGRATVDDARALQQWRARSAMHEQSFSEARRAWRDIGTAGQAVREQVRGRVGRPANPQRRALLGGALAATGAMAVVAVVHPPFGLWPSLREQLDADYRTATGEQRQIVVADQVRVSMNTQTSIALRAGQGMDEIELLAGEAAIGRSQRGRPLAVVAGNGRCIVEVGEIEIRHTGAETWVTCIQGGLQVRHKTGTRMLGPGQRLRYGERALGQPMLVGKGLESAWREGMLVFRDTLLTEAVAEINRYRPGRIVLLNEELAGRRVSGRFRIDALDKVIEQIRLIFGAEITALAGGLVLLR